MEERQGKDFSPVPSESKLRGLIGLLSNLEHYLVKSNLSNLFLSLLDFGEFSDPSFGCVPSVFWVCYLPECKGSGLLAV